MKFILYKLYEHKCEETKFYLCVDILRRGRDFPVLELPTKGDRRTQETKRECIHVVVQS